MTDERPNSNGQSSSDGEDGEDIEEGYEPGDTLHRGTSIACGLLLLFFALLSCGFVVSVLSQRH